MKNKKFIVLAAALAFAGALFADSSTTTLNHTLTGGVLEFSSSAPASHSMGTDQEITATGVVALDPTTFTVEVSDLRGTSSTITIDAELTALANGSDYRTTNVIAKTATGDTTGVTFAAETTATDGVAVTTNGFVEATADYNRAFGFTVELSADALTRDDSRAGAYVGSLVLTLN